ncbi:GGDEF domain-containing protein [Ruminococcaceae bacterium OttesenSCG-928-O06]|nr:GGDEF domain-containing protein [Ruminococcaceae bacterium OttesenSCG-928-O06]
MTCIETAASLLTTLEMLLINLFVIDRCSEKKFSAKITYSTMALSVVVLMFGSYMAVSHLPGYGSGSGLFVFFGFLFALPIKLLYKTSVSKIICLACTSWVYTFLAFSVSIHTSSMVAALPRSYTTFLVQTLIYLVSFPWFYGVLKNKFFPMLSHLSQKETYTLMWMGIVWFWTVFIINLAFIYPAIYIMRILAIASAGVCALNFYRYIYRVINSDRTIQSLQKIAYHDDLTQLRGRALLASDVDQLLAREVPFFLVFMDLNDFKSVNDTFGHVVGDEYLAFFAQEAKKRIGNRGGFYRIAGDEFVALLTAGDTAVFLAEMDTLPTRVGDSGAIFLGVSYGVAAYPADGASLSELLDVADRRMYTMKNAQKGNGSPAEA